MTPAKKIGLGVGAAAVLGLVFWAGTASAKKTGGEPFVLQMMKTVGYKVLPVSVSGMPMVDPDPTSKGPRLIEWVKAEQGKGRVILVPAVYYQGVTNGSPSQILSVDGHVAEAIAPIGIFKVLGKV
jgi:hypothetical protein